MLLIKTTTKFMATVQISFKPKAVSKKLMNSLNPRTKEVITKRYGLEEKERKTLESIGREYGITRERVRQIENFALSTIRKSKDYQEAENIFEEVSTIMKNLGGIVPEDVLMQHISNDEVVHNHINFFMTLSNKFTKHKEDDFFNHRWSVDNKVADYVHDGLKSLHMSIDKEELIQEEEIISRFVSNLLNVADEYKNNRDVIQRYLKLSKVIGKNPLNEWGNIDSPNVKARGIKDYAYLILRREGKPMHFRDVATAINKTFNKAAHVATCHNELIKDKRFNLVGRGMYGLREWGHTGGVVRDIIEKVLNDAGKALSREDIVERVLALRDVKANTVMVNLQNPKYFKKNAAGNYEIA